jgi:hypothetical protein
MTSFSPQVDFLSKPADLIEVERYCRRCEDCWPFTPEFWGKDSKQADGFQNICKACQGEQRKQLICHLEPDTPSRACTSCKLIKPVSKVFYVPLSEGKGFSKQCRGCKNIARNRRVAELKAGISRAPVYVPAQNETFKICTACGEEKPQDPIFWHRSPITRDGFANRCKPCANGDRKLRRVYPGVPVVLPPENRHVNTHAAPPKKMPKRRFTQAVITEKACNGCQVVKPLTTEFWYSSKSTTHGGGFMTRCKVCESLAQKEARRKLRESNLLKGQKNAVA